MQKGKNTELHVTGAICSSAGNLPLAFKFFIKMVIAAGRVLSLVEDLGLFGPTPLLLNIFCQR